MPSDLKKKKAQKKKAAAQAKDNKKKYDTENENGVQNGASTNGDAYGNNESYVVLVLQLTIQARVFRNTTRLKLVVIHSSFILD